MEEKHKNKDFLRSSSGNVVAAIISIIIIQFILHYDFWNWTNNPNFYFGWMTRELLYRVIVIIFGIPLVMTFIQKITWSVPK